MILYISFKGYIYIIYIWILWLIHIWICIYILASLGAQLLKNPPAMPETLVRVLGRKDSLEKGEATSIHGLPW